MARKKKTDADVIEAAMRGSKNMNMEVHKDDWLSSGSTVLNLACSGRPYGALAKGKYFWMVGDSSSGKTFMTLTCMAESTLNPHFDAYDLIFDNAEDGALWDVEKYFGRAMAARLQPPRATKSGPIYSRYTEEFYYHLDDRLTLVESGKAPPFIYLLDSMDSISTKYAHEKFMERKVEARGGKKAAGDYGDGKAKINSTWIRETTARIRDTKSILIVLSQTRDNINAGPFESRSTSAGGRALKFYAAWQLWSSVKARVRKTVNGKPRQIGIIAKMNVKKNRLTGKEWSVDVPIYWSIGMDNVGSCVDFLVDEKYWKKNASNGFIDATDLGLTASRANVIKHIEQNNLEQDVDYIVTDVWKDIEAQCQVERKSRYS